MTFVTNARLCLRGTSLPQWQLKLVRAGCLNRHHSPTHKRIVQNNCHTSALPVHPFAAQALMQHVRKLGTHVMNERHRKLEVQHHAARKIQAAWKVRQAASPLRSAMLCPAAGHKRHKFALAWLCSSLRLAQGENTPCMRPGARDLHCSCVCARPSNRLHSAFPHTQMLSTGCCLHTCTNTTRSCLRCALCRRLAAATVFTQSPFPIAHDCLVLGASLGSRLHVCCTCLMLAPVPQATCG